MLRQTVLLALERELKAGTWKVGEKLPSEAELCRRFSVSRSTIRSAIGGLESQGLVESRQGSGTIVRSTSPTPLLLPQGQDVLQVLEFRMVIEKGVAALAAVRISDQELQELADLYEELVASATDQKKFSSLDFRFHAFLAEVTKNRYLVEIYRSMERSLEGAMDRIIAIMGTSGGIHDHKEILEALRRHDPLKAEQLMARHLEDTIDTVRRYESHL